MEFKKAMEMQYKSVVRQQREDEEENIRRLTFELKAAEMEAESTAKAAGEAEALADAAKREMKIADEQAHKVQLEAKILMDKRVRKLQERGDSMFLDVQELGNEDNELVRAVARSNRRKDLLNMFRKGTTLIQGTVEYARQIRDLALKVRPGRPLLLIAALDTASHRTLLRAWSAGCGESNEGTEEGGGQAKDSSGQARSDA